MSIVSEWRSGTNERGRKKSRIERFVWCVTYDDTTTKLNGCSRKNISSLSSNIPHLSSLYVIESLYSYVIESVCIYSSSTQHGELLGGKERNEEEKEGKCVTKQKKKKRKTSIACGWSLYFN